MLNFKRSGLSLVVLLVISAIVGPTVNAQITPAAAAWLGPTGRAPITPVSVAASAVSDCFPGTGESSSPPGTPPPSYPPRAYLPIAVETAQCTVGLREPAPEFAVNRDGRNRRKTGGNERTIARRLSDIPTGSTRRALIASV